LIRSMTGFGRAQSSVEGYDVTVEIKSVNHRYFDFSSRLPRGFGFLDEKLKSYLGENIARGKVECGVLLTATADDSACVRVNEPLAAGYVAAVNTLAQTYGLDSGFTALDLARLPDVLSVTRAEADEETVWNSVKPVVAAALDRFVAMREAEGAKLRDDVLSRAETILSDVAFIEERSPETVKEYQARLLDKLHEVLADASVDENRVMTEAAIYADKVAVAEETVRLRSHIDQLRSMLAGAEPVGRKLDFLVQEMNREANTIGSKASDTEIARRVINIKAEIEKIREQIQNIE